jgi:hypothetical protein
VSGGYPLESQVLSSLLHAEKRIEMKKKESEYFLKKCFDG